MSALPPILMRGLGICSVSGRMRVPSPAAKTIALSGIKDVMNAAGTTRSRVLGQGPRQVGLIPAFERRQQGMSEVLGQIFLDAWQMRQILRLVIALIQSGENAENFCRPLGAEHGIRAGKCGHVETRIAGAAQLRIMAEKLQFHIVRHVDARVLKERDDVVCGMTENAILKIDEPDAAETCAQWQPE